MAKAMLGLILVCALGGLAFVSQRAGSNPPVATGVIVAIDADQQRIQVAEMGGRESWFRCTEHTTITLNGFAATFNQLAPSQRAEVRYESDSFIALQVDARTE